MINIQQLHNMPKTIKDIQDGMRRGVILNIARQEELVPLRGKVEQTSRVDLYEAYVLKIGAVIGGEAVTELYIIGRDNSGYRSSSVIKVIDFENQRILTGSGNIYGYEGINYSYPDHLTLEICATLNHWGLSDFYGTPKLFF